MTEMTKKDYIEGVQIVLQAHAEGLVTEKEGAEIIVSVTRLEKFVADWKKTNEL